MMKRTESPLGVILWLLAFTVLGIAFCCFAFPSYGQVGPAKPTPIPKPTPGSPEDWFKKIEESGTAIKTTKTVTITTQKGSPSYTSEITVSDPTSISATKGATATAIYEPIIELRLVESKWTLQTTGMRKIGWTYQTEVPK